MYADGHLNLYNTEGSDCFNGAAGTYTGGYRVATTDPAAETLKKKFEGLCSLFLCTHKWNGDGNC